MVVVLTTVNLEVKFYFSASTCMFGSFLVVLLFAIKSLARGVDIISRDVSSYT